MTTIRRAHPSDIPAIARIHVASWRETYRGTLPDRMLASLTVRDREATWRGAMTDHPGFRDVVVAERRGQVVAFGSCGLAWDSALGMEGEIEALYVLKREQLRGVGTRLMGAMARAMLDHGLRSAGLWVSRDNLAAIAFYRTLGGRVVGSAIRSFGGMAVPSVAVIWPDLHELAAWDDPEPLSPAPRRKPAEGDGRWPRAAARADRRDARPSA